MTEATIRQLNESLTRIEYWTLRGGNDPEDQGSVNDAIVELIEVVRIILNHQTADPPHREIGIR